MPIRVGVTVSKEVSFASALPELPADISTSQNHFNWYKALKDPKRSADLNQTSVAGVSGRHGWCRDQKELGA